MVQGMTEKKRPVIGILSGQYSEDNLSGLLTTIVDELKDDEVDICFYFGTVATELVERYSLDDVGFGCHYYSLFSYSNYDAPDILVIIYGNIINGLKNPMDIHRFFAHLPKVPMIHIKADSSITEDQDNILVNIDNYAGMKDCILHLINDHGIRKIGFITGQMSHGDSRIRLVAYKDALNESGIEYDKSLVSYGNFQGYVEGNVKELLQRHPDLTAIATSNDEMAVTVYRVLKEMGKNIGKDFFVTGFDNISISAYLDPPLTTVNQDYVALAKLCVRKIREKLSGKVMASEQIKADLVCKASCGCNIGDVTDNKGKDNREKELLIMSRANLSQLQLNSLIATLILRNLQMRDVTEKRFFEKLGNLMNHIGTKSSMVCLLEKPLLMEEGDILTAPSYLKLYMQQRGESISAYDRTDAPKISYGGMTVVCEEYDNEPVSRMEFLLFHGKTQYGVLSAEISLNDVMFYETLSLEIGSALFFLYLELEQQEMSRALEEKNQILDYSASHDELTGILNRAGVMSSMVDFIHEHREDAHNTFAVVMADLDHLKEINDGFGHPEGDYAICSAAEILEKALPEGSPFGRTGGDEFTGIMKISSEEDMNSFSLRVRALCEDKNAVSGKLYYISVSVGCYMINAEDTAPGLTDALKKADEKLYEAKLLKRKSVLKEA